VVGLRVVAALVAAIFALALGASFVLLPDVEHPFLGFCVWGLFGGQLEGVDGWRGLDAHAGVDAVDVLLVLPYLLHEFGNACFVEVELVGI
jgi:hypothetical protein